MRSSDGRLERQALQRVERALPEGDVAVSAISFWEVSMLHEKRRLTLSRGVSSWRRALLRECLIEIVVDGELGSRANELADFHGDPAGRLIVATALEGHQLVTADRRILDRRGL